MSHLTIPNRHLSLAIFGFPATLLHHHNMRIWLAIMLVACGHETAPPQRTIATLPEHGNTPLSLAVSDGLLYVLTTSSDINVMRLVSIELASGKTRDLAPTLP